jgi:Secretion system C-terminal sorting domain
MKKLLLFTILTISLGLNAQSLLTENCTALTVGNVGTSLGGGTAGQGGWLTYTATTASPAGLNSDYQVVNTVAPYGNVFSIIGATTPSTTTVNQTRFLFKDFSAAWTARTSGNNILEVEFDIFTGPVTTSKTAIQTVIYDATGAKALGGITINTSTLALNGVSFYSNGTINPAGNYNITPTTAITLTANTWYRVGFSFNKTTGLVLYKGTVGGAPFSFQFNGSATATDPAEIDLVVASLATNTLSATGNYDNIVIRASATDTLLGTEQVTLDSSKFSISPNPANDFVNISNSENIKVSSVKITDLNGRVVKQSTFDSVSDIQMNVSDLSSGIYMMNINSNEGSVTKKIIKN